MALFQYYHPHQRESEIQKVELDDLDDVSELEATVHTVSEAENSSIFRLSTLIMIGLVVAGFLHKSEQ